MATDHAPNRRALDAEWQVRFPAKAGPRTVALTFLNRTPALLENLLEPFQKPVPGGPNGYYTTQKGAYLRTVEITGPFNAAGAGDTPSRQRIFVCHLAESCQRATRTKRRARRRFSRRWPDGRSGGRSPTSDLQSLLAFYEEGRTTRKEERFRDGNRARGRRPPGQPRVPVPHRTEARRGEPCAASNRTLSHQRSGTGVPPVVLPVEQHPGRGAARRGELRTAVGTRQCSSSMSGACSPTLAPTRW